MEYEENVPEEKTKEWLAKGFGIHASRIFIANNSVWYKGNAYDNEVTHYLTKDKRGEFVFLPVKIDDHPMNMISAPEGDYLLPESGPGTYDPKSPENHEAPPLPDSYVDEVSEGIDDAEWIKKHMNTEEPFITSGAKQEALRFMFEMTCGLKEQVFGYAFFEIDEES